MPASEPPDENAKKARGRRASAGGVTLGCGGAALARSGVASRGEGPGERRGRRGAFGETRRGNHRTESDEIQQTRSKTQGGAAPRRTAPENGCAARAGVAKARDGEETRGRRNTWEAQSEICAEPRRVPRLVRCVRPSLPCDCVFSLCDLEPLRTARARRPLSLGRFYRDERVRERILCALPFSASFFVHGNLDFTPPLTPREPPPPPFRPLVLPARSPPGALLSGTPSHGPVLGALRV